jgi:hypothetical protein
VQSKSNDSIGRRERKQALETAWILFDKNTMWRSDAVPQPAWREHQKSSGPPALMLNPDQWASHTIALHDVNADHR